MYSSAGAWDDGRRLWKIEHDAQQGIEHLAIQGEVPASLAPIGERLGAKLQAVAGEATGIDFVFDIPLEVAAALTGYRHDVNAPGADDDGFEVLVTRPR